jgi:hypothetical protein
MRNRCGVLQKLSIKLSPSACPSYCHSDQRRMTGIARPVSFRPEWWLSRGCPQLLLCCATGQSHAFGYAATLGFAFRDDGEHDRLDHHFSRMLLPYPQQSLSLSNRDITDMLGMSHFHLLHHLNLSNRSAHNHHLDDPRHRARHNRDKHIDSDLPRRRRSSRLHQRVQRQLRVRRRLDRLVS